jgi:GTP cyclohydrolase I
MDLTKVAESVTTILQNIDGENYLRGGLLETPMRVAKAWQEMTSGYRFKEEDVKGLLERSFVDDVIALYDEMVIVKDINFSSVCEHHMLPFLGKAHIGYIPDGKVVGLSKFARLVEIYARRLQVQERLTAQIAHAIEQYVAAKGVIVVVEAVHSCMCMRGVRSPNATTMTSDVRGAMRTNPAARNEFLQLIQPRG